MNIASLDAGEPIDRVALAKQLDEADPAARLTWLRGLNARGQARLWSAAEGSGVCIADSRECSWEHAMKLLTSS